MYFFDNIFTDKKKKIKKTESKSYEIPLSLPMQHNGEQQCRSNKILSDNSQNNVVNEIDQKQSKSSQDQSMCEQEHNELGHLPIGRNRGEPFTESSARHTKKFKLSTKEVITRVSQKIHNGKKLVELEYDLKWFEVVSEWDYNFTSGV